MDSPQLNGSRHRSPRPDRYSRSRSRSLRRYRSHSRSRSRSRSMSRDYRRSPVYGYRPPYSRSRRPNSTRDNPNPSRCLGVFGLSLETQEADLYDFFSRFGEVEDVNLIYDNYTGRSRGFGFVYFRHQSDSKAAKNEAHGMKIDGRHVRIDYSITDRPHSPTPGIYMGRPSVRRGAYRSPSRGRYSRSRSRSKSFDERRY